MNLAEDPPPLADQLIPQIADRLGDAARLAPYRIGTLAVGRTIEYEVRANWKVVVENFMECYHCAPMHPELVRLLAPFLGGTNIFNSAVQYYGLIGLGQPVNVNKYAPVVPQNGIAQDIAGIASDEEFGLQPAQLTLTLTVKM